MSLATNVQDLATRVATEVKALRTLINGNAADLSGLSTTAKTNLVAAINEVAAAQSGAAGINDAATGTTTTWSSSKTSTEIANATAALIASAPAALNTLDELAAALGDDPNFATTITTALGNRVRFDAAQTLTAPQQTQALANIGAAAASHTHTASAISDSTATGRSVLTAVDATAARTAIGAGTSNLAIGTTSTTAKAGDYAPPAATTGATGVIQLAGHLGGTATSPTVVSGAGHTHTASQTSDSTTTGRSLMTAVDAASARTAIGAGTSNLVIGTTAGTAADAAAVGSTTTDFVATFNAGLV